MSQPVTQNTTQEIPSTQPETNPEGPPKQTTEPTQVPPKPTQEPPKPTQELPKPPQETTPVNPLQAVKNEIQAQQSPDKFSIKIVNIDGSESFFKIKETTKMSKVFDVYAKKQGQPKGSLRFIFDGNRIDETMTAKEAGLSDNDVIDALVSQTGGTKYSSSRYTIRRLRYVTGRDSLRRRQYYYSPY